MTNTINESHMRYGQSQLVSFSQKFIDSYWNWLDEGKEAGEFREKMEFVHDLNDSTLYPDGFTPSEATAYAWTLSHLMDAKVWLRAERHLEHQEGTRAFLVAQVIV